jgi:cytochrome c-type biogenesis protein
MPDFTGGPSISLAFIAGAVSFLSPCVLPLVPGYLSYMSGLSESEGDSQRRHGAPLVAVVFVLGFTLVFVALGASATLLGSTLRHNQDVFVKVGGAFIILMGLAFMGVLKLPFLYRERRFHPRPGAGTWGAFLLGMTFAFGWSPCIGPTMGAVLTMAAGQGAEQGGAGEGAFLLGVYSLGLGLPFLLAGLGISRLAGAVAWLRKHTVVVTRVSGALLVIVGILFMTDQLFRLSVWMQDTATSLNWDFWSEL